MRHVMNPEIKQKWITALRSGDYKQGKYRLKQEANGETCHCCLGVLAEMVRDDEGYGISNRIILISQMPNRRMCEAAGFEGDVVNFAVPLWLVLKHAPNGMVMNEIDQDKIDIIDGLECVMISTLNDNLGFTFTEMANLLEELEGFAN